MLELLLAPATPPILAQEARQITSAALSCFMKGEAAPSLGQLQAAAEVHYPSPYVSSALGAPSKLSRTLH
jgi:hypothetical protein